MVDQWNDLDANALRKARESAGLDATALSRLACLSVSQIRQLEEGGMSCFYTPSIKRQAGLHALTCIEQLGCRQRVA